MILKNNFELSDFLTIHLKEWQKKVLDELKTESTSAMKWQIQDLSLKTFYTEQDLKKLSYLEHFHTLYISKSPRKWQTREVIPIQKDLSLTNHQAQIILTQGIDAIGFNASGIPLSENEITILLHNISLKSYFIHIYGPTSPISIANVVHREGWQNLQGSLSFSPLNDWLAFHRFPVEKIQELIVGIQNLKGTAFRILSINSSHFHHQELGVVKEIAYPLSLALDYMDKVTDNGLGYAEVLPHFEFSFSIGKNYFLEIAKLRAFRLLWYKLTELCDPAFDAFSSPIHCITSAHYLSEDTNKNIFQNTTEAMAAIIGGCDSINITPSKAHTPEELEFTSRIARNISLILKEEAYFDKTTDPGAGSYYIENLTHEIASKAWNIITAIEKQGGFIKVWEQKLIS